MWTEGLGWEGRVSTVHTNTRPRGRVVNDRRRSKVPDTTNGVCRKDTGSDLMERLLKGMISDFWRNKKVGIVDLETEEYIVTN